ncbi:unnamed protein product [Rhodiola kirilowii]
MGSCKLLVVFVVVHIVCLLAPASAQSLADMYYKCSRNRNYTNGSAFESNLSNMMLSYMVSENEIGNGFYNVSEGLGSDRVYSVALCRGDLKKDACHSCVNSSSNQLMNYCPNQKEGIMWSNDCMLRYSNHLLYGVLDLRYSYIKWNERDGLDVDLFNKTLGLLLGALRDRAVAGNASLKYDIGEAKTVNNRTIYALVQCTPDLYEVLCGRCLDVAISNIPKAIPRKQGGKYLGPSCTIRFQTYKFYDSQSSVALLPPPTSSNSRTKGSGKKTVIVVVLVAVVFFGALYL